MSCGCILDGYCEIYQSKYTTLKEESEKVKTKKTRSQEKDKKKYRKKLEKILPSFLTCYLSTRGGRASI